MRKITIYTWGYWGWGNAASELVKAVDAVEQKRGFKPPLFVDIRMKRSARPMVFRGQAFGQVVGKARYDTMSTLGNEFFLEPDKKRLKRSTRRIVIHDPSAAEDLLDRAVQLKGKSRHIIFFCACEFPHGNANRDGSDYSCHRTTVSRLLLKFARIKNVPLEVVEWPGGSSKQLEMAVSPETLKFVRRGGKSVLIPNPRPLANWAGIAWGSVVKLHCHEDALMILTGPAKLKQGTWSMPVLHWDEKRDKAKLKVESARWRRKHGMEPLQA